MPQIFIAGFMYCQKAGVICKEVLVGGG